MTTATEDIPIFFPILEITDWRTLKQALATAVTTVESESAVEAPPAKQLPPVSPEAAGIAAEADSAYRAIASTPAEVTAYMEYAFDTAPGSRENRLERLVVFAPTWWEASQLVEAFANERLLSGGLYNLLRELQPRWLQAELGVLSGKAKWLVAIGIEPVRTFLSPDLGPVDMELLKQLPRLIEIGATPFGPSFADRLGQMLEQDAKKRQQEYETRRRAQREERDYINNLANRRRRRIRGERVEETEDPREAEALLASTMRRWTPEMTEWALYAARVKILGVQVSAIIRNSLLSVEQKKKRIVDVKVGRGIVLLPEMEFAQLAVGKMRISDMESPDWDWDQRCLPSSDFALWENLNLVETELFPIYQLIANIRVEFRLAEMWAEARRGPAEQRGRVDMIPDHATGPIPVESAADKRAVAIFREAAAPKPAAQLDHTSQLARVRAAMEIARFALADWQTISDPAEKEQAIAETRYLIGVARKAQRKIASPLPGAATGNRRRRAEARLPLLKAARLRRKAEAKAHKAPVAENKQARRKKERAA